MRNLWMMALMVSACAMDEVEDVGTTEQAISGWAPGAWGTTRDLVGADTGWPADTTTCVMTAVLGDLGEGGYWQVKDVASYAGVKKGANGNYFMIAHGGAYTNQTNDRVWADNRVMVGSVCIPYPKSDEGLWKSSTAPKWIGPHVAGRRCFLNSIAGGGQIFTHSGDYVRVRYYSTTDANHPTAGWYVEGNLVNNPYTGQPAYAGAFCVDFPSIANEWTNSTTGTTETVTSGTGVKMCGLTGVHGAFNVDSWSNGVTLDAPSTQTGNWTLTASAGKTGDVRCVQ